MSSINKKSILLLAILGAGILCANNAFATTWYVRDGGGTPTQCTGTTNAVYPGNGNGQACAFSNPMYVLGAGCGNTGGNPCDVASVMQDGDTLYVVGDSDISPGQQAQYPIGLDTNGIITPNNTTNCYAPAPENCTMANMPSNSSIIGIGTHKPQLWGREQVAQVLNDNNSSLTVIDNLEITQHSACVYNGADPQGTTGGFPNSCHTPDGGFSSPYGNWGLAGISLTGSGITLENNWIHGMAQWGVSTGSLTNFTEANNIINGNGGGGMGLGQNISNAGTMTLGGTTTVSGDIIVFNGCGSVYPLHSSNPFDVLNYHNCADDSSSNGTILADGWAMEAGSGVCNDVNMSNTIVAYNTKGGIDNLHCNGSGTFNAYRVRAEGNESQQMKLNYGTVNIENSQIINDCNYFEGQTFTTTCDAQGNCPPALGYDFCRASGDGLRLATVNGGTYNIANTTFYSNGGANIELPPDTCNTSTVVNVNNNLIVNAPDYTNGDTQNTDFWENDTGSCSPIVENYNLIYAANDPSHCAGSHDICSNPTNAGVTGNFALNGSNVYMNTGLADQFYPSSTGPLVGAANSALPLSGTSNDYNNVARATPWDLGSYQHGSLVADGSTCFLNAECSSGVCLNNSCTGTSNPSNPGAGTPGPGQPVVNLTSPVDGSTYIAGSNITINATASETDGTITNISFYNGASPLGSTSSSPYTFTINNVAAGIYTIKAVATDANGVSVASNAVSVTVSPVQTSTPVVSITSPSNNQVFTSGPVDINLSATASETNGTITKVQFFDGTMALNYTGTSSPYNYTWSNVEPGTYTITAVATDANGVSTTSSAITITVTAASSTSPVSPAVAITSPTNNEIFTSGPLPVNLSAIASETNGTIAKVQFFDGGVPLSYTGTSAPYNYTWKNVQPGTYTMTAVATDANGVSTTSSPVTITVTAAPASLPVVAITSPSSASNLTVGSDMTITASASETNGTISNVAFYNGTNLLGSTSTAPYTFVIANLSAGTYTLTAKAIDTNGNSTTSSPVTITVTAPAGPASPVVNITSPSNNQIFNSGPLAINLSATASETNGTIAKVQFLNGGVPLNYTGTSAPYNFTWNNVQPGTYTLTAVATDANGNSTTSSAITITVTASSSNPSASPVVAITLPSNNQLFYSGPLPINLSATASETNGAISKVQFFDGGVPLSYTGTSAPYNYTWKNVQPGTYTMTAVATDANGVSTSSSPITITVTSAAAPTASPVVAITSPSNGSSLTAGSSMTVMASASETNGTISSVSFYNGTSLLGSSASVPYSLTITDLSAGTYTLTAKAIDANGNSTTSNTISITVTAPVIPSSPVVAITSPSNGSSLTAGSSMTVTASASETNGTISSVSFYNGTSLLGSSTSAPYSYTITDLSAGTYTLTAKATDANGNSTASSAITLTVTAPVPSSPVIAITSPGNNTVFTNGPLDINLSATASETNGTITQVQFFDGTVPLSYIGTSSPYNYTWKNVQPGTYIMTAVATDANGNSTTSSPVTITVTAVSTNPTSAPVIAIISPSNNSVFTNGPLPINLSAIATETNGTIVKVQFFDGGVPLSYNGTSSPYNYTWNNVQPGTYTMTAVATDANGISTSSSPITITVTAPVIEQANIQAAALVSSSPPVVAITSPSSGSSFPADTDVSITATASETNGTITNVNFYDNGSNLIGSSATPPYGFIDPNLLVGKHILTAVATDIKGVSTTSSSVTITLTAPVTTSASTPTPIVIITNPTNNSTFTAGSYITFTASASESNGSISKVAFYYNGTIFGTVAKAPYTDIVDNLPSGNYTITAVATDANGNTGISSPISITISSPVSSSGTTVSNSSYGSNTANTSSPSVSTSSSAPVAASISVPTVPPTPDVFSSSGSNSSDSDVLVSPPTDSGSSSTTNSTSSNSVDGTGILSD